MASTPEHDLQVRRVREEDFEQWRALYKEYAAFYQVAQSDDMARRVWSWLCDPSHEVCGLVVEDTSRTLLGLAHYRPFARPLSATIGCFLDDLYVDPAGRGAGAADLMLTELARIASVNKWSVVRWITADDNYRGRGKYDQYASRTHWVTYDMEPSASRA
jgi:ribosomal protein S18 acetylase RimI-like enzyme